MSAGAGTVGFNSPLASCCMYHVPNSVECCEKVKDKLATTAEHNKLRLIILDKNCSPTIFQLYLLL